MIFAELIEKRQNLNRDIFKCLLDDVSEIRCLAENMSECATDIKGQGFSTFIQARESFLYKIDVFQKQLEITTNTHDSC